jgi:hypothetical protein
MFHKFWFAAVFPKYLNFAISFEEFITCLYISNAFCLLEIYKFL